MRGYQISRWLIWNRRGEISVTSLVKCIESLEVHMYALNTPPFAQK